MMSISQCLAAISAIHLRADLKQSYKRPTECYESLLLGFATMPCLRGEAAA